MFEVMPREVSNVDVFNCVCDISFFDSESLDPSDRSFGKKDSWCHQRDRETRHWNEFHFGILERPGFGLSSSNQGLQLKLEVHDDPHFLLNMSIDMYIYIIYYILYIIYYIHILILKPRGVGVGHSSEAR